MSETRSFKRPPDTKRRAKTIDDVLAGAPNDDVGEDESAIPAATSAGSEEVRFTMTMPRWMADDIDEAAKEYGIKRISWLRIAAKEKISRDRDLTK